MTETAETQVVLVEDHLALRRGIELLLQREGLRVIGVADSAPEARRMILARRPDVAIIDIGLERGSGLEVATDVLSEWPEAAVLLYTGGGIDESSLRRALASGVRGLALKAGAPAELVAAIHAVAAGHEYLDPRLGKVLAADHDSEAPALSPREREILDLLAVGLKTDEIAERLVISPVTVDTHVRNLKRKLGARTRVHALALALKYRNSGT